MRQVVYRQKITSLVNEGKVEEANIIESTRHSINAANAGDMAGAIHDATLQATNEVWSGKDY